MNRIAAALVFTIAITAGAGTMSADLAAAPAPIAAGAATLEARPDALVATPAIVATLPARALDDVRGEWPRWLKRIFRKIFRRRFYLSLAVLSESTITTEETSYVDDSAAVETTDVFQVDEQTDDLVDEAGAVVSSSSSSSGDVYLYSEQGGTGA